ncbi:Uncharacterised protein [Mycobacteroides abscessus]|nr:Uncharacterised protein [Mycobacteroides abscessus]
MCPVVGCAPVDGPAGAGAGRAGLGCYGAGGCHTYARAASAPVAAGTGRCSAK